MGEALYTQLSEDRPELAYRTYAPVGSHRDLLAYLVRRLLENGANSSFVALAADERVPVDTLLRRPADIIGTANMRGHPTFRCRAISISRAQEFARHRVRRTRGAGQAVARYRGRARRRQARAMTTTAQAKRGCAARAGFAAGTERRRERARDAGTRRRSVSSSAARISSRCCSARAARRSTMRLRGARGRRLLPLLRRTGAKGCSARLRKCLDRPAKATIWHCAAVGVFVAISPGISLAIFWSGNAALMAGNAVGAKAPELDALIAAVSREAAHEAGIRPPHLNLVQGDGEIGAALVAHPGIAVVVFTGRRRSRARSIDVGAKDRADRAADRGDPAASMR
jgi:RHH-type proline utilization regulon transcriptional repressor/proline dehydrogenase/delta 1-pyrroline-5-carboxylate dehydrogenase